MEQKPLVQQYSMDNIYDAMDNEEAWIGVYYAGDCMLMMQDVYKRQGKRRSSGTSLLRAPPASTRKNASCRGAGGILYSSGLP